MASQLKPAQVLTDNVALYLLLDTLKKLHVLKTDRGEAKLEKMKSEPRLLDDPILVVDKEPEEIP